MLLAQVADVVLRSLGRMAFERVKLSLLRNNLFIELQDVAAGCFNAFNSTLKLLQMSLSWASKKISLYFCIKCRQCPAPA